ncbi:MAG: hypothetical protein EZS28_039853 [Streblomastix strix]|uniref:Uncharacterized protein n=1 Tax=Streblomastix strix TaxID=222440 RepID=A0A5J4U3B9_9EUKA|nr:MAG: hypothetical protein EZS28_039853 [Streblomastix strix]
MLMALFRGVGEDQIKLSDIIENTLIEYAQIQSEIIQLNIEISKVDNESIGDYEEMIFVLRMMAESNRANLSQPFEWEVEIDQLTKKEIKKQQLELLKRQNSLLLIMKDFNNPNSLSSLKVNQNKAIQSALQTLPQRQEQITIDLSPTSLLQIKPKIHRILGKEEIDLLEISTNKSNGILPKKSSHPYFIPNFPNMNITSPDSQMNMQDQRLMSPPFLHKGYILVKAWRTGIRQ